MAPRYDEAPELAEHTYPEVHHPSSAPEVASYHQSSPSTPYKPLDDTTTIQGGYSTPRAEAAAPGAYGYDQQSPAYGGAWTNPERGQMSKRVCGCSLLVFILSAIIAILSAAVIGLAAGTGVEASRANTAEAKLATLNASATASPWSATGNFSDIDRGCSTDSSSVTGTTYTTHFFDRARFMIYCNSDTPNAPLQSFWVANFDDCLDACASYSYYMPSDFSSNATSGNATCAGLSFIPAWTNRTFAVDGGAPGNCYLKPGPQNATSLTDPNIGGATVHAAILQGNS